MRYPRVIATCNVLCFEIEDWRKLLKFIISYELVLSMKFQEGKNEYKENLNLNLNKKKENVKS